MPGSDAPSDAPTPDGGGGGGPVGEGGTPNLLGIWDLPGLVRIRSQASQGPLKPAYDKAVAAANDALAVAPASVTMKTKTPPSGDKHDYLSLARYWWPDPNNPNGPYIQKDGQSNPEIMSDAYDYKSMFAITGAITSLGLGYFLTGDEKYAQRAHLLLAAWFITPATRMNPNFNYAQSVPGVADGRSEGVIDGLQFAFMLDAVELLKTSPSFTAADFTSLSSWFSSMLTWLGTNSLALKEQSAGNNHGTWYDVQVARYHVFVGNNTAAATLIRAAQQKRIAAQIQPDGTQPQEMSRTNSFDYVWYNLTALFDLAHMGKGVGVDLFNYQTSDGRSIKKALDFLTPYVDPQKAWPNQQINPPNRDVPMPILRRAGIAYQSASYEQLLQMYYASTVASNPLELQYPK
jgi:hypothetical protein